MIKITEKSDVINAIFEQRSSPGIVSLTKLLTILIHEIREDNDSVDAPNLPRNQGKIDAYKSLLDYISKGVPNFGH
jgi:hypothetical protein